MLVLSLVHFGNPPMDMKGNRRNGVGAPAGSTRLSHAHVERFWFQVEGLDVGAAPKTIQDW